MKKLWDRVPPKHRRLIVIFGAFAAFALTFSLTPSGEERDRSRGEERVVRSVLTDQDNSGARIERLIAQVENMRDESRNLHREIDRMRRDMGRIESGGLGPAMQREIDELNQRIEALQGGAAPAAGGAMPAAQSADGSDLVVQGREERPRRATRPVTETEDRAVREERRQQEELWDAEGHTSLPPPPIATRNGESESPRSAPTIRTITSTSEGEAEGEALAETDESEDKGVYLPAGSIITGTLVTGMDAPTGQRARNDPHPALLRVKHEAILPNRFRADVRECFIIVGGYGDLSSERAYLRGETISCVREDGGVVESRIESYTVGEDGKAGLRGRLVNKQGQMLARALGAGFLEGFSRAFDRVPIPTINLDADQPAYQQMFNQDMAVSGAATGMSRALDRLAQFYIEQAEAMFPVIEIFAGREVDLVIIRGGQLQIRG